MFMIVRQPSALRHSTGGTLEGAVPTLVVDGSTVISSSEEVFRSVDDSLGIDQQVAWIEGTLSVSF